MEMKIYSMHASCLLFTEWQVLLNCLVETADLPGHNLLALADRQIVIQSDMGILTDSKALIATVYAPSQIIILGYESL